MVEKMKQNYKDKIKEIIEFNNGLITRKEIDEKGIPSVFLYRFVKNNNLWKIGPGVFATQDFQYDELFIFQKRNLNSIFSGLTALYLNGMTDKVPEKIEITVVHGSNSIRNRADVISHTIRNKELLDLGTTYRKTIFGNYVKTFGPERLFCNLVKNREREDPEVFVKGIRMYANLHDTNQDLLFFIADKLHIKMEVFKVLELINENQQEFFAS